HPVGRAVQTKGSIYLYGWRRCFHILVRLKTINPRQRMPQPDTSQVIHLQKSGRPLKTLKDMVFPPCPTLLFIYKKRVIGALDQKILLGAISGFQIISATDKTYRNQPTLAYQKS